MAKKKKRITSTRDVVRGFRIMCRLSREDLAEKIGVTYHAVGSWETGMREPSFSSLNAVGKQFGPFEELFWDAIKMADR
tara:strand:+ start:2079 stop:2315 length:237 start_codon:yes stop_codon:yes gene_type:complete